MRAMSFIRTVARGSSCIHLLPVRSWGSQQGGADACKFMRERRPGCLLMESYWAPGTIETGKEVPYAKFLNPLGVGRAISSVAHKPELREKLSAESLAVLTGMEVGSEIRFADREHAVSFDRLVARMSVNEMLSSVAKVADAFGSAVERQGQEANSTTPWAQEELLQNLLCPFFPELWRERHLVMASTIRRAALDLEAGERRDVMVVLGAKHVEPLAEILEQEPHADEDLLALLGNPDDTASFEDQLEKRAALVALLVSTRSFPPGYVLPASEDLLPEALAIVKPVYTRVRGAIMQRMGSFDQTMQGSQAMIEKAKQAAEVVSLQRLQQFCETMAKT